MSTETQRTEQLRPLEAFTAGMSDGYNGRPRRKNQGAVYLRAYRNGVAGRTRAENGGEDTTTRRVA